MSPTIAPAAGLYTSAQSVTLSSSEGNVTIRYTLDGSDPTSSSTLYSGAFSVTTAMVVKARAFRALDSTISDAASSAYTFNYGTLSTPVATPGAGPFQQAPQVTLSADGGTTIRYTLDGSDPTASSTLYAGAISIASGGQTVKARAFKQDWTTSSALTAIYSIDNTDPTIVADIFPALLSGWMSTPVTVTFRCSDASGIASCSSPTTFSTEGANQTVTGTAVDLAGNDASTMVTVSLDLAPPVVTLTAPADGTVTSATTIQLTGNVSDALSGVVSATCNGVVATIDNGAVTCTVPLRPGRNAVVLQASDAAGQSASAGVTVSRIGTPSRIALSPATRTLLVGESTPLSLSDDFGISISDASWSSSNTSVVQLSENDPPRIIGVSPGASIVTATKSGLTTTMNVAVVAGTSLPDGTVRWSVAPTPGVGTFGPLYANRVNESSPAFYAVEWEDTQYSVAALRAMTSSGVQLWTIEIEGQPLMADTTGGVLIGLGSSHRGGIARISPKSGVIQWRYESVGTVDSVTQANEGTIYALEDRGTGRFNSDGSQIVDTQFLLVDGDTGIVRKRIPIPREVVVFRSQFDGISGCSSKRNEYKAPILGPFTHSDGSASLLIGSYERTKLGDCVESNGDPREIDRGVTLWKITPTGLVSATEILDQHCSLVVGLSTCDIAPVLNQLLPDTQGGSFTTWAYTPVGGTAETRSTHVDSEGVVVVDRVVSTSTEILIVGDEGTLYSWNAAVDAQSLDPKWSFTGTPQMALHNGGVITHDGTNLRWYDGDGALLKTMALAADSTSSYVRQGEWISTDQDYVFEGKPILSIAGPIPVQTRFSFGQITSRPLGVEASCIPPDFGDTKGLATNREYSFSFDRGASSLWPSNDNDNDIIPNVLVAFEMWNSANTEPGGALPPRNTTFTKLSTIGPPEMSLKQDVDVDLGLDERGEPIGGLSSIQHDTATGVSNGGTITWDNEVTTPTFYRKIGLHELGHFMGLGHGFVMGRPTSVMNVHLGREDEFGQMSQVVTVCDRDRARESAQRPWP